MSLDSINNLLKSISRYRVTPSLKAIWTKIHSRAVIEIEVFYEFSCFMIPIWFSILEILYLIVDF